MPSGNSIVLERQPGADAEGYAGLEDDVDNHWGMLFEAAVLSTPLSIGAEASPTPVAIALSLCRPARSGQPAAICFVLASMPKCRSHPNCAT
jgi:hypothetical protein